MSNHHGKNATTAFGIDIGGSGIKGAPVDLATGEFAADRVRIPTPSRPPPPRSRRRSSSWSSGSTSRTTPPSA